MAAPVSTRPGWRFGVFEVDARRGELRRAGVLLKLRDQSFQILIALLDKPGDIVTREELRRLLWPSDTFVDFDHSLNTAMMKLRDALGDSTEAPIYIETVPKRGYRFIAPVSENTDQFPGPANGGAQCTAAPSAENHAGAQSSSPSESPARKHRLPWLTRIALGCAVAGLAGAGYLWFYHRHTGNEIKEPTNFRIVPVVSAPGITLAPSLSPDGRMVAYIWDGPERRYELYVKLIGAELPHRITYESGRMGNPAWSPDGREIAITRCGLTKDEGFVILVPALGGPERRITEAGCPVNLPSSLAWSSIDGGRLVFIDHCAADRPFGLISFSLATGKRDCLTDAGPPGSRFTFSLSPDGTRVAFIPSTEAACNIYVMPVSGGKTMQVVHDRGGCYSPMWTPDGQAIVFTSDRTTLDSLWRVSVAGGDIRKEPFYPAIGSFSGDGRRFVYEQGTYPEPPSVWRADLASAGGTVLNNGKFIATQTSDVDAQPSPDGGHIAWMSQRTGSNEIWIADANGDRPRQLTHLNSYAGTPRWSPDGKWIAFDFYQGSPQIFVIDVEGRNLRQVTSGSGVNVVPSWSRDGKWIYFASERSGRKEVWKHSLESGKELQLTTHGGFNAFESLDGRTVYFSRFDEAGIWSIPSQGGTETLLIEGKPQTLYWGQWALTTAGIYFMNVEAEPKARIDFYDFATRRVHPILTLDKLPTWAYPSLSSTADGMTIYYSQQSYQSGARMLEFSP